MPAPRDEYITDMIDWGRFKKPKKGDWATQYIYALTEPLLGVVRYIGRTASPRRRYICHINAPNKKAKIAINPKLYDWIGDLEEHGLLPKMLILDICSYNERLTTEKEWIQRMLDDEQPLLNIVSTN